MGERRAWLSSSFRPLLLAAIFYLCWAGGWLAGCLLQYYCCVLRLRGSAVGGRARARGECRAGNVAIPLAVWDAMPPFVSIRLPSKMRVYAGAVRGGIAVWLPCLSKKKSLSFVRGCLFIYYRHGNLTPHAGCWQSRGSHVCDWRGSARRLGPRFH